MDLRELAAFREVARQSSFSQAASRLGYAQSTVSAQVQSLEQDLGTRLFDRLPRTVLLTDSGRALLPHAEQILGLAGEARQAVTGAASADGALVGTVSVSAPETLLTYRLPGVLSRFRTEAPGVTIDLRPTATGRFRGETRRRLAAGTLDLAFVLDTPLAIGGFHAERLVREGISVIAPTTHPLAGVRRAGPRDLDGASILLPEAPDSGCAYRGQWERQLADRHVTPSATIEFASIETVKQCVVAGMGVSVLPTVAVAADVAAGRLATLRWSEPFEVHTQMVWNERRSLSPAMAAFVDVCRGTFSASVM